MRRKRRRMRSERERGKAVPPHVPAPVVTEVRNGASHDHDRALNATVRGGGGGDFAYGGEKKR